jgi:predicted MFS family arabinose efflux permease
MVHATEAPAAAPAGGGRPATRPLILGLAISQTVGYGVLFYAFSVLLTPIAHDLHATTAAVTGALTASIVAAAAVAIPCGRWLDRRGGRALMTGGSLLGVAAVLAWSQVQQLWQLYAVFILIGLAGAASLYEAAFPVVIMTTTPALRDRALLIVTIVAGFASSIFFPLTGVLLEHLGWRTTLLVLAAALAVLTVPVHAVLVPGRPPLGQRSHTHTGGVTVRQALRQNTFWLIAAAFVAQAAAVSVVGVLLVTALRELGQPATIAATVSGLLGILSVTGRLITTGLARRHGMTTITAAVFAVQAAGVIALPHLGHTAAGAAACILAFGLGFGVGTIAKPAILADRYGTARYATISATMTLPMTLAKAFAPLAAASVGVGLSFTAAGFACLTSAGLLWTTRRRADLAFSTMSTAPHAD